MRDHRFNLPNQEPTEGTALLSMVAHQENEIEPANTQPLGRFNRYKIMQSLKILTPAWVVAYYIMLFYDLSHRNPQYLNTSRSIPRGFSGNHDYDHGALVANLGSDIPAEPSFQASTLLSILLPAALISANAIRARFNIAFNAPALAEYSPQLAACIADLSNRLSRVPRRMRYGLYAMTLALPAWNYGRLITYRPYKWGVFNTKKMQCEANGMQWRMISDIGNYGCTVCEDVYYPLSTHLQGCMDGFFSIPQPVTKIISFIDKLSNIYRHKRDDSSVNTLSRIDLSQQDWLSWSLPKLEEFSQTLQQHGFHQSIRIYNLSRADQNGMPVTNTQGRLIADCIFKARNHVHTIDVTNQWFGPNLQPLIARGNGSSLSAFYISGSRVDNSIAAQLAGILPSTGIKDLRLANNEFGNDGVRALREGLSQSSVTTLDLTYNPSIGVDGWYYFNDRSFNDTALSTIIYDNNPAIGRCDGERFGQGFVNSSVSDLSLERCSVNDNFIIGANPSLISNRLRALSLAYNNLQTSGVCDVFSKIRDHDSLGKLSLDGITLSGDALQCMNNTLPGISSLKALSLAYASLPSQEMKMVWETFLLSSLDNLSVRGNANLRVELVSMLSRLSEIQHGLKSLDIGGMQLTPELFQSFLPNAHSYNLTSLRLDNNYMGESASLLENVIIKGGYSVFDISHCKIPSGKLLGLFSRLKETALEVLLATDNSITNQEIKEAAKHLLPPFPEVESLGGTLSIDAHRMIERSASATRLTYLGLAGNNIDSEAANALCQVLYRTHMSWTDLDLSRNPLEVSTLHVMQCPYLPSQHNQQVIREEIIAANDSSTAVVAMRTRQSDENMLLDVSGTHPALYVGGMAFVMTLLSDGIDYMSQQRQGYGVRFIRLLRDVLSILKMALPLMGDGALMVGLTAIVGIVTSSLLKRQGLRSSLVSTLTSAATLFTLFLVTCYQSAEKMDDLSVLIAASVTGTGLAKVASYSATSTLGIFSDKTKQTELSEAYASADAAFLNA